MVGNSNYSVENIPDVSEVSEKTDTCYESILKSEEQKRNRINGSAILDQIKNSLNPANKIHPASLLGKKGLWEGLEDAVGFGYVKREAVLETLREYVEKLIPMYTDNSETGDAVYWGKKIKEAKSTLKSIKKGRTVKFNGITLIKTPGNYGS